MIKAYPSKNHKNCNWIYTIERLFCNMNHLLKLFAKLIWINETKEMLKWNRFCLFCFIKWVSEITRYTKYPSHAFDWYMLLVVPSVSLPTGELKSKIYCRTFRVAESPHLQVFVLWFVYLHRQKLPLYWNACTLVPQLWISEIHKLNCISSKIKKKT